MFPALDDIVGFTREPDASRTAACRRPVGQECAQSKPEGRMPRASSKRILAPVNRDPMDHPNAVRPQDHAVFNSEKMGKSTIFESERIMVGLNSFNPGQEHKLHAHAGMDKVYYVLEGSGVFVLEDREIEMEAGIMLVAPEGVPHGIRNTGSERLVVLAVLAPSPNAA